MPPGSAQRIGYIPRARPLYGAYAQDMRHVQITSWAYGYISRIYHMRKIYPGYTQRAPRINPRCARGSWWLGYVHVLLIYRYINPKFRTYPAHGVYIQNAPSALGTFGIPPVRGVIPEGIPSKYGMYSVSVRRPPKSKT